jgi:hypothetical protein
MATQGLGLAIRSLVTREKQFQAFPTAHCDTQANSVNGKLKMLSIKEYS